MVKFEGREAESLFQEQNGHLIQTLREVIGELAQMKSYTDRIIESASCGIAVLNRDGDVTLINSMAAELINEMNVWGLEAVELQAMQRRYRKHMMGLIARACDKAPNGEAILPVPEGRTFIVQRSQMPDTSDETAGHIFIFTEITSQVQYREMELRARLILNHISDAVIAIDLAGCISEFNHGAELLMGMKREQVIGTSYNALVGLRNFVGVDLAKTLLDGVEYCNYESSFFTLEGLEKNLLVTTSLLKSDAGQKLGAIAIYRDVTERRHFDERIRQAEKLAIIGELAAGTAHEIRNPLTSVKGFIQLLSRDFNPDSTKGEYASIVLEELERVEKVITQMLMLAKPSAPLLMKQNLIPIIDDLCALLYSEALLANVELINNCPRDIPELVIDAEQIRQVFLNIAYNAIQAMPKGGILEISAWHETSTQHVAVAFKDEGIGIAPEALHKVSDPFFSTKKEGTGLGLTVSHRIVSSHRGYIEVDSKEGVGTTFVVKLPVE